MNRIFRIVWNTAIGHWVVASETAKGRKKKGAVTRLAVLAALAMAGSAGTAHAGVTCLVNGTWTTTPTAPGTYAVACGDGAQAQGRQASAFGSGAKANADDATALGSNAVAQAYGTLAMGNGAAATGEYSNAIGGWSRASGYSATGIGSYANAAGGWTTAVGFGATTTEDFGVAIGYWAVAGYSATAVGYGAQAQGDDSLAMGSEAVASASSGVALGTSSRATAGNSVALGTDSVADRANTVSVGTSTWQRQIVNMAKGTADTDAVNVSQLKGVTAALGGSAAVSVTGSITAPSYALPKANSINGTSGNDSDVGSALTHIDNALGNLDTRVAGNTADISNLDGRVTTVEGNVASLTANINNGSIGLVQQDATSRNITVSKDTDGTIVDVTGTAGTRKITGVTAGDVSATSTDAVNGSQLYATNQAVGQLDTRVTHIENSISDSFSNIDGTVNKIVNGQAGMFQVSADNTTAPMTNGTNAAAGGAGAVASGNNSTALGNNAQAAASNTVALGNGSVADRANTVSVGSAGNERQITHVQAGTATTDAVNVSQLQGTIDALGGGSTLDGNGTMVGPSYHVGSNTYNNVGDAITNLDSRLNDNFYQVNHRIDQASRQANRGIASAAALVMATPYMPGRTMLNAGMASYRGQAALGVGVSRWNQSGRVNVNAGISAVRNDQPVFRVGVGMVLGE